MWVVPCSNASTHHTCHMTSQVIAVGVRSVTGRSTHSLLGLLNCLHTHISVHMHTKSGDTGQQQLTTGYIHGFGAIRGTYCSQGALRTHSKVHSEHHTHLTSLHHCIHNTLHILYACVTRLLATNKTKQQQQPGSELIY